MNISFYLDIKVGYKIGICYILQIFFHLASMLSIRINHDSGVYNITVQRGRAPVPMYCELDTNGENWLVSYFIIACLIPIHCFTGY